MIARLFGSVLLVWGNLASAEPVAEVFEQWVDDHGAAPAALAVASPDGSVVVQIGLDMPSDKAAMVGSLSKTVAGVCAMALVRNGRLSLETTLGQALSFDGPAQHVTVKQLLTHSGGIWPDSTQGGLFAPALRRKGPDASVGRIRDRPVLDAEYRYNNENFLLLEAIIQVVLDQTDALDACLALEPLSGLASLGRHERYGGLGLAGGLEMSAGDLAVLMSGLQPQSDWPFVAVTNAVSYGPGVLIRNVTDGAHVWHTGALCTLFGPNIGAFGARMSNGWSVGVVYQACAKGEAGEALQRGLAAVLLAK